MKKRYILSLVLAAIFAQNVLSSDNENNENNTFYINKDTNNNIDVNNKFSIKNIFNSTVNIISEGLNSSLNYAKKQSDPIQYATSDENIKIVKFATTKFLLVTTIEDLQKLQNFSSGENDELSVKGNLFKKVGDRNTAFTNVMCNILIKLTDGTYSKSKQLEKEQFNTTLNFYIKLQEDVYKPAIKSMNKALSVAYQDGLSKLVSHLTSIEIKENNSNNSIDKEDK